MVMPPDSVYNLRPYICSMFLTSKYEESHDMDKRLKYFLRNHGLFFFS